MARQVAALRAARPPVRREDIWIDPETDERRTIEGLCGASLLAFDLTDYIRVRHGDQPDRMTSMTGMPHPDLVKFGELPLDQQDAFIAAIFLVGHQIEGGRRAALPPFECVPSGNRMYHSALTSEGWAEMMALSQEILLGRPAPTRAIIMGLLDEPMP